ncbi:Hsp70 family protein [Lentimicrobium sp. S6]|uniref:Hsp70 family protein n=1 Tax=Lentimicrobium sp. S6 TaxID=2735872 RepID=UPI0015546F47|nr:Hsp70 family protein [Lentimicrobium sp. S6]NPD47244.1 Hsp70 family protein [Lentimicrobium sp. S6]
MTRSKIDYGIDLGTTNSAISRMENGEPIIQKTDVQKDTAPSCIAFNKKKSVLMGDGAFRSYRSESQRSLIKGSDVNSFIEFKRTMGTDKKYFSSHMEKEYNSEELSAEILKGLKSYITDENVKSVVVTVPAKFTVNQKDATLRAAKIAGIEHCELLQEPIAASMAYGLVSKNKDGNWLVFDFGGGTFDAALLKVEDGIMKVVDTEGDNYLGGKNLDYTIVEEIMIPHIEKKYSIQNILNDETNGQKFKDALKFWAEDIKNQLSFKDEYNLYVDPGDAGDDDDGEEIEIDITVNQEIIRNTLGPVFQKAINISKELIERNNLDSNLLDELILVGGPTYSPILREMLEEQIIKPDTSVDPMTVVSKGAALFASTVNVSDDIKEQQRDKTKIQLELGYEATTVEEEELISIIVSTDKTEGEIPDKVFVDIVRNDNAWSSGKTELDSKNDKGEKAGAVDIKFNVGKANAFNILTYNEQGDLLPSEPSSFTIIQGSKIGSATLPYHYGIEILDTVKNKMIFYPVKGLEKNQSTPCTGTVNDLKVLKQIRPGNIDDIIKIPIYQGEYSAEGTRAMLNEHVFDVVITGDDIPTLLPEGSSVDITMKVDRSELIQFSAYFPSLEFTYEVEVKSLIQSIDTSWLESEISKAEQTLRLIKEEGNYSNNSELNNLENEISETKRIFEQDRNGVDRKKQTLNNLRKSLKKLDKIEEKNEWPKTEKELKDVFYRLEETNNQFGNDKTNILVEQFKEQIPEVIKDENVKIATELIDNMRQLDFMLVDQGLGAQMEIMYLKNFNNEFDILDWKDRNRARMTIDRGLQIAADNPTKEALRPIIIELYKLLPIADQPKPPGGTGGIGK